MKSIFDPLIRQEVLQRIDALQPTSQPQWGTMDVGQMVRHCALCEEYYFGKTQIPRSFLGRLIGPLALRGLLKDDNTRLGRNAPTNDWFKVKEPVADLDKAKEWWKSLVADYANYQQPSFLHWFFGKMTRDQLGQFVYKHCDHHLRQFGV